MDPVVAKEVSAWYHRTGHNMLKHGGGWNQGLYNMSDIFCLDSDILNSTKYTMKDATMPLSAGRIAILFAIDFVIADFARGQVKKRFY